MWTIIKFDKKKISFLKKDLEKKLGSKCKFYLPKIQFTRFKNNKLIKKEFNILGDYIFCFNNKLNNKEFLQIINFSRGVKKVLTGFMQSQTEIIKFIEKCQISENSEGYISEEFYELKINKKYKFFSGPFADSIFKILELQKYRIKILMGDLKTTLEKKS